MSIYINAMKMPKEGDFIVIRPDGKAYYVSANPQNAYVGEAVPVPPHGDLIERNALDADLERQDMHTGEWDAVGFSIEEIENAPTIIPASEEET